MSVKKLINALFKLSGSQAMPSDAIYSTQTYTSETSGTYNETIAPVTGYACFEVNDGDLDGRLRAILKSDNNTTDGIGSTFFRSVNATFTTFIPCVKGRRITHLYTKKVPYTVTFIAIMGGG